MDVEELNIGEIAVEPNYDFVEPRDKTATDQKAMLSEKSLTYDALILQAVAALKQRGGSSVQAIFTLGKRSIWYHMQILY